ncbi:hypothetical protein SELMODRAFT_134976, partial [Selaginella moellendorffii]
KVETKVLEGKIVGLLFSVESNKSCSTFVNKLLGIYDEIQKISTAGAGGVGFEVVFVSGDTDEASFKQSMKKMPWLALPFDVKGATTAKLARRFKVEVMPSLVLVDSNGTTLLSRYGYSLVTRFGSKAFPFAQEHIQDLEKVEDQNASKLPVELKDGTHEHRDYVIRNDGSKVSIQSLQGFKCYGLAFVAHWYPTARAFVDKHLIPLYEQIRARHGKRSIEIIFVSDDLNYIEFMEFFQTMPWLALPFQDRRTELILSTKLNVQSIPAFAIFDGDGKLLFREGRSVILRHGLRAYPFTPHHVSKLDVIQRKRASKLPADVKHPQHEHTLDLVRDWYDNFGMFVCDACLDEGNGWFYHCERCSWDLHPACANPKFDLQKSASTYFRCYIPGANIFKKMLKLQPKETST